MLSLRDVDLGFERSQGEAPASVTLEFAPGTVTLLAGPSGSGNSSLLRIAAGLAAPVRGHVAGAGRLVSIAPPGAGPVVVAAPLAGHRGDRPPLPRATASGRPGRGPRHPVRRPAAGRPPRRSRPRPVGRGAGERPGRGRGRRVCGPGRSPHRALPGGGGPAGPARPGPRGPRRRRPGSAATGDARAGPGAAAPGRSARAGRPQGHRSAERHLGDPRSTAAPGGAPRPHRTRSDRAGRADRAGASRRRARRAPGGLGSGQDPPAGRGAGGGRGVRVLDGPERAHGAAVEALLDEAASAPALVFATHDVALALRHATRVVVLDGGRITYDGGPDDLPGDLPALPWPPLVQWCRQRMLPVWTAAQLAERAQAY